MTLTTLLLYVAIAGVILTLITYFVFKKQDHPIMSFAQNYVGALFIFSGWVKAVDPLGTAYKMQDYFAEFEALFQGTWFSFLAPMFPFLSEYSIGFSVLMIVFEIVLGLMLILGHKPKLTAWLFLLLVLFFTVLTGFTYLTGYVPEGSHFFHFGDWSAFKESNMKVTDCGCFGDFIVLKPKTSFLKDVFLLIPAFYFLKAGASQMHQLFTHNVRSIILLAATVILFFYCRSNYVSDIPGFDFRPFREGRNLYADKLLEEEAQANVHVTAYSLTNKSTGKVVELPYAQFLKEFKNYPKEEWEYEQITSEPTIEHTKLGEFEVNDLDGYSLNEDILNNDKPVVFIVAYKLVGDGVPAVKVVQDTVYTLDTLRDNSALGYHVERKIEKINERTVDMVDFVWKDYYAERYVDVVRPFVKAAREAGLDVVMAVGGAGEAQIDDFENDIDLDASYGTADDLLLKTIVRSNPGILLIKKGVLLDKWHYKKLPSFEEVKEMYLK